jgi:hypothetical protein
VLDGGTLLGNGIKSLVSTTGTVAVVIPSMTFDSDELAKIPGAVHFEERMLWLLQSLRDPESRVVYVTSEPLPERLVAYSASLTGRDDATKRLTLISCDDPAPIALTHKIAERPDVQQRIRDAAGKGAVLMCHVATEAEGHLADVIGAQLFACPPNLAYLGTKSGSRRVFAEAGVPFPDGVADLADREQVIEALAEIKARQPNLQGAVVKLNDSFAGGGNCVVTYPNEAPTRLELESAVESASFVAAGESADRYFEAFGRMGGVVESWLAGERVSSPSVQVIVSPSGDVRIQSTHEQILGGTDGQTFFGCTFPASSDYSVAISRSAERVAEVLSAEGVRGHLSIDFVCRETAADWEHFAIEINLRMGGATAPISFLESATGGVYNPSTGLFAGAGDRQLSYKSADRIQDDAYRVLDPGAILDELGQRGLLFDGRRGSGAILYMLGAARTVGKIGLVAVDRSHQLATNRFDTTLAALDEIALGRSVD